MGRASKVLGRLADSGARLTIFRRGEASKRPVSTDSTPRRQLGDAVITMLNALEKNYFFFRVIETRKWWNILIR